MKQKAQILIDLAQFNPWEANYNYNIMWQKT